MTKDSQKDGGWYWGLYHDDGATTSRLLMALWENQMRVDRQLESLYATL